MNRGFSDGFLRPKKDGKASGITVLPIPYEKKLITFEKILKNELLDFDQSSGRGYVRKAVLNVELFYQPGLATTASNYNLFTAKLDDTRVISVYRASATNYVTAHVGLMTEAGGYTMGTEVVVDTVSSQPGNVVALSPTKALVVYDGNTPNSVRARILNISGTTITLGASVYTIGTSIDMSRVVALSETKVVVFYRQSSASAYAVVGDISGDVITFGTVQQMSTINCSSFKMLLIDSSSFVVYYHVFDSTYSLRARVVTVSGTIMTFGSELTIATNTGNYDSEVAWLEQGLTFLVLMYESTNAFRGVRVSVVGTTLTAGTIFNFGTSDRPYAIASCTNNCVILSRGSGSPPVAITYLSDSSMRVGRVNTTSGQAGNWQSLINVDGIAFLQSTGPNGGSIAVTYYKAVKYVSAIAKEDAGISAPINCLVL